MIDLITLLPEYPMQLPAVKVGGLKLDSRQVAANDLFIAVPGYQVDGRHFIDAAIAAGAAVVLADSEAVGMELRGSTWVIEVPQLKNQLSHIAGRFFHEPSQALDIIGVTGTNGKTSVTYIAAQLLESLDVRCGVIGTTGSGFPGHLLSETHTTPDAIAVQHRLHVLRSEGAQAVAMEVSSHALVQRRAEAVHFKVGVATNISRDHLDYHGTMANYAGAKRRLFTELDTQFSVLNADDSAVAAWLPDRTDSWRFSLTPQSAAHSLWASDVRYAHDGTEFTLNVRHSHDSLEQLSVHSPLLGGFNVYNLLAAIGAVITLGHPPQAVVTACNKLHAVPGRMEAFGGTAGQPLVIVDYAHTPDALQQVLSALRRHCQGQLWCVFGCGGDRDRGKRPQMGAVAADLADQVVVTDDNPRTEEPEQIVKDILAGMPSRQRVQVIMGRDNAVRQVIAQAKAEDVVLLAGKGHEDYQIIGQQRIDYDERKLVAEIIAASQSAEELS